jgi:hypothetical protein
LIDLGRRGISIELGWPTAIPLETCQVPDYAESTENKTYVEGAIQEWKSIEQRRVCKQRRNEMNLGRSLEISNDIVIRGKRTLPPNPLLNSVHVEARFPPYEQPSPAKVETKG